MPDRKGIPHPCGSAAPSLARTLCSSGMPFLPGRAWVLLCGLMWRFLTQGSRLFGVFGQKSVCKVLKSEPSRVAGVLGQERHA